MARIPNSREERRGTERRRRAPRRRAIWSGAPGKGEPKREWVMGGVFVVPTNSRAKGLNYP